MIVGVLTLDIAVLEAMSLKDKRRVVRSIKDRVRHRYNVSISEVDEQDVMKRCKLGIAMVAVETRGVHSQFDRIVDLVRATPGATLIDYERTML
jgi:uncharacterized protein YlxP (DUF503 family)